MNTTTEALTSPQDVGCVETCPVLFFHGDRLVEVGMSRWEKVNPTEWILLDSDEVKLPEKVDRVIFELPIGCFEGPGGRYRAGDTILFEGVRDGGHLRPCRRHPRGQ